MGVKYYFYPAMLVLTMFPNSVSEGLNNRNLRISSVVSATLEPNEEIVSDTDFDEPEQSVKLSNREIIRNLSRQEHMINEPKLLEALVQMESSSNLDVGCNHVNACGLAQLKASGIVEVIAAIYSRHPKYLNFQSRHSEKLALKRERIDLITGNYFAVLSSFKKKVSSAGRELNHELDDLNKKIRRGNKSGKWRKNKLEYLSLRKERKKLARKAGFCYAIGKAIREGYLVTNPDSLRKHKRILKKLEKNEVEVNGFLAEISGEEHDWLAYIGRQEESVRYLVWVARELPSLNLLIGDAHLAYDLHFVDYQMPMKYRRRAKALDHALEIYNKGWRAYRRKMKKSGDVNRWYSRAVRRYMKRSSSAI